MIEDIEFIKKHFSYDPETGIFRWISKRKGVNVGDVAGGLSPEGFIAIPVNTKAWKAGAVAYVFISGSTCPDGYIVAHKDGDRTNCRASNIEICKKAESWSFKDMIDYNPNTGNFSWRHRFSPNGRPLTGAPGWPTNQGYVRIASGGVEIQAHRLAYRIMMGCDVPDGQEIDHINGDRSDNRWCNLRVVSRTQNNMNAKVKSNNSSGFTGVSYDKRRDSWAAEIKINKRKIFLGRFATLEEAVDSRRKAEIEHFGEYSFKKSRGI